MLFEIVNARLVVSEEALMIEPFKSAWETDTTEQKEHAMRLFRYIHLVCCPKKSNPFIGYHESIRPSKVKLEVYGDANKVTTEFMMTGVMKYMELLENCSPSYSLLTTSINAAEKLKDYLDEFDLNERTQGGTAVIKPKDITGALKEVPEVVKKLEEARNKVILEIDEDSKTRNQRKIGQYER